MSHETEEWQRLQAELQEAKEQLARAQGLVTLGHVAAQSAHRLNSCLAVIEGYAQLLLEEEELGVRLKAKIKKIDEEAQEAAQVVAQEAALAEETHPRGND